MNTLVSSNCLRTGFLKPSFGREIAARGSRWMRRLGALAAFGILLTHLAPAQTVTATVVTGNNSNPQTPAVNPVTNKIYVPTPAEYSLTVIDGATNKTTTVEIGQSAESAAVNPVTNKIYVTNESGNSVTVIDGSTDMVTATVTVGSQPNAIAINSVTDKIYVANNADHTVSVIDGTTDNVTSTISVGTEPDAIAVNPVTNKIYVANFGSNSVSVIDGATNKPTTLPTDINPYAIAVNPVSNQIYVANEGSNKMTVINGTNNLITAVDVGSESRSVAVNPVTNKTYFSLDLGGVAVLDGTTNKPSIVAAGMSLAYVAVNPVTNQIYVVTRSTGIAVIDGVTNNTSTVAAGMSLTYVAVNPVTNKIYASNQVQNVTVIDGATNNTATVTTGTSTTPSSVAVNPVTGKIYVPNRSNMTVIDGSSNNTSTVATGANPVSAAVNPVTNKIYVTNSSGSTVSVVDGASNNLTGTISVGNGPYFVAVNPVTNKIYVANQYDNNVTVIDGATSTVTKTVPVGSTPIYLGVNPVTNKVYVANNNSSNVTVIDGATNITSTVAVGQSPASVAVNSVTNQIYVADQASNTVTVIDGVTNMTQSVAVGMGPDSVAVNPTTNKIYVANYGSNTVTVIDGATNNVLATVNTETSPFWVAVNPVTNKIYVANYDSKTVTVVDGATNTTGTVATGTQPLFIAVNPFTNKIYVANGGDSTVTVITEAQTQPIPLTTAIAPLTENQTTNPVPGFSFTASSTTPVPPETVFYQFDTWQSPWTATSGSNPTFTGSPATLQPGFHILYAYATDGQEATSTQPASPLVGSIQAYGFLVIPVPPVVMEGITINTAPSGLQVSIDGGAPQTAPVSVTWNEGDKHTISTTSPQGSNGTRYTFTGWSDGTTALTDSVTATAGTTSYTASFGTAYLLSTSVNPAGQGTVAVSAPSPTGDGYYPANTQLMLTATPTSAANLFSMWTGTKPATSNPLSITLTGPTTETANFATNPGSAGSPLAYEPFGETPGTPLNGISGSGDLGWAAPWIEQYGSTVKPGYQTAAANPLSYPGLATTNSYAIGGYAYQSVGRQLNVAPAGPFAGYLANGLIGAPGQTIWVSFLLREDANPANGEVNALFLTPIGGSNAWQAQTGIGIGSFGGNWGLQYNNGTPVVSNVPVTPAQSVLLVASITFGSTNQINLYVNPTSLGGSAPVTASAQLMTTSNVAFQTVSYLGGYTANDSSLSDIQVGPSYAAVTHTLLTSQTITFAPPASPVTYPAGPITLMATASSGLPVTFSVLSGPALVNGNTLTITGVGTVMVAANQGGNYLYAPAPQVTQTIVVNVATAPPNPVAGALLAFEPFNENSGTPLNGAAGGGDSGWNAAWVEQTGSNVEPGYQIASANPLSYTGLQPTTNYAIGGYAYQSAGRPLDVSAAGPFSSYLSSGLIGASGQTVWLSFLLREDANPNNGQINALFLTPDGGGAAWIAQTGIGIGYFGTSPYWGLQLNNGTPILSSVPVQQGQTVLMVVSITFGATNQVNLYVNPALGGSAPATASAQLMTGSTVAFQSLSYLGGYGTSDSSLAAIRFGSTYSAVTPTTGQTTQSTQTINFTPPASPVTYPVAPITLSATASSGLPVTLSVMSGPGSVTGTTLTVTGTGTIVIAANQAGNSSYAPAPQVIQSLVVNPSGGATSTNVLAYEPFGETSGSPLNGASGGGDSGWNGAWVEQTGETVKPGYQIASANPLTYSGLATTPNYTIGGYNYESAGRQLNTAVSGPFLSYLSNGLIGAPGQTIWLSFLLRQDANPNNGQINAVFLTSSNVPWVTQSGIGVGYFGTTPAWGLQLNNGNPILSSTPVQQGQAVLMVVSVTFGATNQINLYVNPVLGGAVPSTPSAQLATTTNVAFHSFSYLGGYMPNDSSLSDIRFGASFAAVTPAP